jgi:DNA polymerase IV
MILHADADAFFASVEQRDDPRLRGRPTIVGPGVVMAASYEARARGVRGGMGTAAALRLCPGAAVVSPRFDAYVEASRGLFEIFRETSPVVEGISLEEAFLDVSGLERISGTPAQIGCRLRRRVRERVGLAVSVGIGSTKAVAKMASNAAKPDGMLHVPRGREIEFLHPLPVEKVWGVGPSTAETLRRHGVRTVGEMAAAGRDALVAMLGPARGRHLHALAHNRDPRPVRRGRGRRSVGAQSASVRPSSSPDEIDAVLVGLVDRVTRRMRAKGRTGRTVVLRLRFSDFSRATRSRTLPRPTAATAAILAAARGLLAAARPLYAEGGLTLVGITVANLSGADAGIQLELPLEPGRRAAVDDAVDEIRERFGTAAVTRGVLVGRRLATDLYSASESGSERSSETRLRNSAPSAP